MRDPILLTPGPLTTSLATKVAMLNDWGSWDVEFNALTAQVCRRLVAIVDGQESMVCVPLQGSGTFAVEAAIGTLVPREGKLLVLAPERTKRIISENNLGTPIQATLVAANGVIYVMTHTTLYAFSNAAP